MGREIRDQVVVVTGASSGVGRAIARTFGAKGARVAVIARNQEALDAAAKEIRESGGDALVLPLDVTDAEAVEAAAARVEQTWGRIDTWVNVAMVTVFASIRDMQPDEFKRLTEVTYLGYVYGTLAALRRMLPRDEGTIIQIGSALAYRSIPLQSAYCVAKAAIRGFTDSLRTELIHDGSHVKVSMLQLPAVNTPQAIIQRNKMKKQSQPVPPLCRPEMIADAVVWAVEHHPREMLIGWPTVQAVWGNIFFSGLLDLYLGKTGYQSQFVDKPNDPTQPGALYEYVPGDHGAHGPYTDRETRTSKALWARMHPWLSLGALGLGIVGGSLAALRGRGHGHAKTDGVARLRALSRLRAG